MKTIMHLLLAACAVLLAAYLLPGVEIAGVGTAVLAAILLGLVGVIVGPVLFALTIPINFATLGLFTFVIAAIVVKLVDAMLGGFYVANFGWAIGFALVFAFFNGALERVVGRPALHHR